MAWNLWKDFDKMMCGKWIGEQFEINGSKGTIKFDLLRINELEYFSSEVYPAAEPAHGWIIKNCNIGGVDRFMHFEANNAGALHAGAPLVEVTLENLNITGILMPSLVSPDPDEPLIINIKNINSSGDLFYPEINNLILNY